MEVLYIHLVTKIMKKLLLIAIVVSLNSCIAQTIKPLFSKGGEIIPGGYYKDLDNDFNKFIGTWEYSNGTTSLKIVLQKKTQVFNGNHNAYYDLLVGEYRYVENGIEKVNTLSLLTAPPENEYGHSIVGAFIIKNNSVPVCDDCSSNERRVALNFTDPERPGITDGLTGKITLRRVDQGTTQKIQLKLRQTGSYIPSTGSTPTPELFSFNLPWGEYILTKVP